MMEDSWWWSVAKFAGNHERLSLVRDHENELLARGEYELALVEAWRGVNMLMPHDLDLFGRLYHFADPDRLRETGDPIPERRTLYRGVRGPADRHDDQAFGFAWTGTLGVACGFASVYPYQSDTPAVFELPFCSEAVLFYTNDRGEDEYVVDVDLAGWPERLDLSTEAIHELAARWLRNRDEENQNNNGADEILTRRHAAELLGCTVGVIDRMRKGGAIPGWAVFKGRGGRVRLLRDGLPCPNPAPRDPA